MNEAAVIQKTEIPATVESLQADFLALGVRPGMVLVVHSSLSAMGWVCGGAVAVILALQKALGSSGTLIMPAHSTGLTEPSKWESPPVPRSWWSEIRESMPAYDIALTPTRCMGSIGETFRKQRGVLRSAHPHVSFCACGPHAPHIVDNHELAYGMGEHSPLARVYDLHGHVCFSEWVMEAIRRCTSQNTGQHFQANVSSRKELRFSGRVREVGPPSKMLTSTVRTLVSLGRTS